MHSVQARTIYDYFRQLFAQVTNSPIDPIRESIVVSFEAYVGPEGNLLEMKPEQCRRIILPSPLLTLEGMEAMENLKVAYSTWSSRTLNITFPSRKVFPVINWLSTVPAESHYRRSMMTSRLSFFRIGGLCRQDPPFGPRGVRWCSSSSRAIQEACQSPLDDRY